MTTGLIAAPGEGYCVVVYRTMIAVGFIAIGFIMPNLFSNVKFRGWGIFLCGATIYVVLALSNGMVSMVSALFQNPLLYLVNGCLGSYLVVQCAVGLDDLARFRVFDKICSIFRFFGRNTLIVLCTHIFFIELIRLFDYKLLGNFLPRLGIAEGIVFCAIISLCEGVLILFWSGVLKPEIKILYAK